MVGDCPALRLLRKYSNPRTTILRKRIKIRAIGCNQTVLVVDLSNNVGHTTAVRSELYSLVGRVCPTPGGGQMRNNSLRCASRKLLV